jgi:hemerythrin
MDTKTAWEREIALGYEGMDREHGLQLQLLDALEAGIAAGADPLATAEILEKLLDYSDVHFGSEELLMRLHSYPRYGLHVEEHRRLVDQLQAIRAREGERAATLELVRELRRWVSGHIQAMDRDFVEHVTAGADST